MTTKMVIPYGDQVDMNLVDGVFSDTKFGINEAIGTSFETIMANGGLYPDAGVETLYVSSDSTLDVLVTPVAVGIDSDGVPLLQSSLLNGQNGVLVPVQYWKGLSRGFVDGGVDAIGNIYYGTEPSPVGGVPALANQRLLIPVGEGQSQQARLVVPAGVIIVLKPTFVSVTRNDDTKLGLYARRDGGVWRNQTPLYLFQESASMKTKYSFPELTEVEYRGKALISTTNMSGAFGYRMYSVTEQEQQDAIDAGM